MTDLIKTPLDFYRNPFELAAAIRKLLDEAPADERHEFADEPLTLYRGEWLVVLKALERKR